MPDLELRGRLDDGVVGLRPLRPGDLPAFEAAARPGGNAGIWLRVDDDDPAGSLDQHLAGHPGHPDPYDLSLAIVSLPADVLIGHATFVVRAPGSVEITYGVAPDRRGQGVATRAARLASDWLLGRGWDRVELRIDDANHASQRVAAKAGFRPAGRIRTWVNSAGRDFEDMLFVRDRAGARGTAERGTSQP